MCTRPDLSTVYQQGMWIVKRMLSVFYRSFSQSTGLIPISTIHSPGPMWIVGFSGDSYPPLSTTPKVDNRGVGAAELPKKDVRNFSTHYPHVSPPLSTGYASRRYRRGKLCGLALARVGKNPLTAPNSRFALWISFKLNSYIVPNRTIAGRPPLPEDGGASWPTSSHRRLPELGQQLRQLYLSMGPTWPEQRQHGLRTSTGLLSYKAKARIRETDSGFLRA